jgi:ATP-dependent Zn protease
VNEELICSLSGNTTSYLDENLSANRTYYYSVSAYNVVGEGLLYEFLSIYIPEPKEDVNIEDHEDENNYNNENNINNLKKEEEDYSWLYFSIFINLVIIIAILSLVFIIKKKNWMHKKSGGLPRHISQKLQPPLQPRFRV